MSDYIKTEDVSGINKGKVFFDANIWIFLYCEIASTGKNKTDKYSKVFRYLLKAKIPVTIDFTIISEFVNRYLRISFNNYIQKNELSWKQYEYKKKYRPTADFQEAWKNICNILNHQILPHTEIINADYNRESLASLLNPKTVDTDINDNHIIDLCKKNNMYLLTDDGDFKNSDIQVISANQKYWE